MNPAGLPHSDIPGSLLACSSPRLFAACHVLHRRPVPRHPPYALIRLTHMLPSPPSTSSEPKTTCGAFALFRAKRLTNSVVALCAKRYHQKHTSNPTTHAL